MPHDIDVNEFLGFLTEESNEPEWRFIEGERRDVAVLFADVHGFTDFSRKLDPEVVHLKMDELMKLFTKCTHYYGGFVDKYIGDSIMSLFGAKKATEQDTERAILTGLKMIQQMKLFNALLCTQPQFKDVQFSVRIGINTGLVSVGKVGDSREGDFTVYGNTVNLASRMESNAPENKIMVSLQTMLAVEHFFDFERVGYKELKGFDEPIECFVVVGPKQERGQRWRTRKTPYIGRRAEVTLLQDALAKTITQAKQHTAVFIEPLNISITGDAGMGKSRLLFETVSPHQNQIMYLYAVASGTNPAPLNLFSNLLENYFHLHIYQPLTDKQKKMDEGIARLCNDLPADSATGEALLDAVPLLGYLVEIPSSDPRLKQKGKELLMHIQQAIMAFMQAVVTIACNRHKALIISWDDLHWADEAALKVLDYLYKPPLPGNLESETTNQHQNPEESTPNTRSASEKETLSSACHQSFSLSTGCGMPILSFMLYRDWDCKPGFLSSIRFNHVLALSALKDSEIVQLIKQQADKIELPASTIEKVRGLSAGNPFYLEEWCNYIFDLPKISARDFPVPTNLHALILSRLDRLSDAVRLLLQKASVIGQEFFVEILREIEHRLQNPVDTDHTLAELENQSLILKMLGFDYSAYFFKHITTREVAYQTLLQINRKMLHQLTAEAIESIFPDRLDEFLFALAEHYQRAEIDEKAIFFLGKAATAAAKNYSNNQAISYYDKLLAILPESDKALYTDVVLKKAEICWMTGLYDDADTELNKALIIAESLNDKDLCFEAYRQRGIHSFFREDMSRALHDFKLCLEIAGPITPDITDEPISAKHNAPDAAGIKEHIAQHSTAHNNLGIWYQHTNDFDQAIAHHQKSLHYAEQINDDQRKAKTLSNLGLIYIQQKDFAQAKESFQSCLDISSQNRYLREQSIALGNLGFLSYKLGELDQAMHYYEKKWLIVDKLDDKPEMIKLYGNIANVHRYLGQHREALDYYRKTLSFKESMGNKMQLAITLSSIAIELSELNRLPEALNEIAKAIDYAAEYPSLLSRYQEIKSYFEEKIK